MASQGRKNGEFEVFLARIRAKMGHEHAKNDAELSGQNLRTIQTAMGRGQQGLVELPETCRS